MTRRELVTIKLDDVEIDPAQVRASASDTGGLAASLASGQLYPILVYPKGERYVVLDGHRRVQALRMSGAATVNAVVVAEPQGTGECVLLQLIANLQREDLSPMDRAQAFSRYLAETGCTAKDLAERVGLSPASVSRSLALLTLPPERQAQVAAGELTARDGYRMACHGDGGPAPEPVGETKSHANRTERPASGRAAAHLGGGRQVTFIATGEINLTQVVEMAEDVLAKARKYRNRGVDLATFLAQLKLDAKASAGAKSGEEAQS